MSTERDRLKAPAVNYMELRSMAGAFSCGTCSFATDSGFCTNRNIEARVSLLHGCCNLFDPEHDDLVPPAKWKR